MSRFLLEQLDKKFVELEEKKDVLLGQDEDEDTTDEANVTGNMDGGAGPIKTPNAFAKSTDEDDLNIDNIEVLGYKKSKKSKSNFESITRMESNLESIIEATYKEYKNDDSMKAHQKVNTSIKEINRLMWEITKIVNQNSKLKTETGVHTGQYWKSTQKRFGKISERMLKVARQLKELSA
jgi:hypothetical protein